MTVSGYDTELVSRDFKTVSAVLDYTHPLTGLIYHIVIHQAIEIPNFDHHLLCPMQCRVNDITINYIPKFQIKTPTPDSHSIVAHDVDNPLTPLVWCDIMASSVQTISRRLEKYEVPDH